MSSLIQIICCLCSTHPHCLTETLSYFVSPYPNNLWLRQYSPSLPDGDFIILPSSLIQIICGFGSPAAVHLSVTLSPVIAFTWLSLLSSSMILGGTVKIILHDHYTILSLIELYLYYLIKIQSESAYLYIIFKKYI